MDAVVAEPYGLGEGQKDKDYAYVVDVCEALLAELKDVLNEYHKTDHSLRYWRIVLGHWLHWYASVIFNRWFTLQQALDNYNISGTTVLDAASYSLATPDSSSFLWACNDAVWNHVLYSTILRRFANINLEVDANSLGNMPGFREKNESSVSRERQLKHLLKNTATGLLQMLSRNKDAFIINSYLPKKEEIKLQISLVQVPQLWQTPKLATAQPDISLRERLALNPSGHRGYDRFVRALLMEILPACYLEGYQILNQQVRALPWPKKPKFIFTSNNFDTDEIFKAWTGAKVEQGVQYFTGQHGNNYGTEKRHDCEMILEKTSDKFITWGWTDGSSKHVPAFIFKTAGRKQPKVNKNTGLLLIEDSAQHRVHPWDKYSEFHVYQDEQFRFVEKLPAAIHQQLTVRLYATSYKRFTWCDDQRWKDRSPGTRIDNGETDIWKLTSNSRLVVHSYDSTGILETLSLNIPTLCFWHGGLSHLRESAKPYYQKLGQAGILQDSPELAAKKVAEVWDDVPAWWNSEAVQDARKAFCERYARTVTHPVRELKNLLTQNI
jgi:putative transferase (TIGR04331 family)